MEPPDGYRLRVKWDKGRNYFQTFFSELDQVRKGMDSATFTEWCIKELHLGVGIIVNAANVLKSIDAALVKETLATARAEEQRQKKIEQAAKSLARMQRAGEKAKLIEERKEAQRKAKKRKADRKYRKKHKKLNQSSVPQIIHGLNSND